MKLTANMEDNPNSFQCIVLPGGGGGGGGPGGAKGGANRLHVEGVILQPKSNKNQIDYGNED